MKVQSSQNTNPQGPNRFHLKSLHSSSVDQNDILNLYILFMKLVHDLTFLCFLRPSLPAQSTGGFEYSQVLFICNTMIPSSSLKLLHL